MSAESSHISFDIKKPSSFFLLGLLIVVIYSNTFHAGWHLDDYQNILTNSSIQIDQVDPNSLARAAHHPANRKIWRPMAMISFALNWYFGGSDVFGYHLVNIGIHILNSWLLLATILLLMQTPRLERRYRHSGFAVALMATAIWAAHPIQTQAVTYIVQRMASLATFFYLLCLFTYLKFRLCPSNRRRVAYLLVCFLSFLSGVGTKENAVLAVAAIGLLEVVFFMDLTRYDARRKLIAVTTGVACVLLATILLLSHLGRFDPLAGYGGLGYTPVQRLLTQSRILLLYISQLLYPIPSRLSIEHDVSVSTSLFSPWTTLPSILVIGALLAVAVWQMRRRPLFSWAILFFFLNHAVESGVIALELVFEHRNYLPSAFIFAPVAAGIQRCFDYYRRQNKKTVYAVAGFTGMLILALGSGTYIRNFAWQTEKTLWTDAHFKAPRMSRPLSNLAWGHYERIGRLNKALMLYRQSLELDRHRPWQKATALNNMASIYYRTGNYADAQRFWEKALAVQPNNANYRYRRALALFRQKQLADADRTVLHLLDRHPENFNFLHLAAMIRLHQQKPRQALLYLDRCLTLYPRQVKAMVHSGVAYEAMGEFIRAESYYRDALNLVPGNALTLLRLVNVNIRQQDGAETELYMVKLQNTIPPEEIFQKLDQLAGEPHMNADTVKEITDRINRHFMLKSGQRMQLTATVSGKSS